MAAPHLSPPPAVAKQHHRVALVIFGLAFLALLVFSRSPDLLLTARFFAEDGKIFYAQAHELGFLRSIFVSYAGYFHLFPRLVAGVSLWLPLFYVPLFFNVVALTVHCVVAVYICSPRMRNIGPLPLRMIEAFLYLGLPHIGEVWGRLTNSQWQLAVLSFLILIASPPKSRLGAWFDTGTLAVAALTGPFCILLLPVATVVAVCRRSSRSIIQLAILSAGAVIQAIPLLIHGRPAEYAKLGASFPLFCRLLVRCLFLGIVPNLSKAPQWLQSLGNSRIFGACLLVVGIAVLGWMLWRGSFELRCMLLFGATVIAASLVSPIIVTYEEQWPTMLTGVGERYWFIPKVVLAVAVLWLTVQPYHKWARIAGVIAMLGILVACIIGWHIFQRKGVHFRTYIRVFDALPIGAELMVPVDPPNWRMRLSKKPSDRSSYDPGYKDGEILDARRVRSPSRPEKSTLLTGAVLFVNGAPVNGQGTETAPMHVSVRAGALLEGWALLPTRDEYWSMDQMYAQLGNSVVTGDRLPLHAGYQGKRLEDVMYLVFMPSMLLHPGLQEVKIVGYSRRDNALLSYPRSFYLYGE